MLVRVLVVAEPPLRRRLVRGLRRADALVGTLDRPGDFWARVGAESCDLVIATRSALRWPATEILDALRGLPDRPELILLTEQEDPEDRAALLAAGVVAVVYLGLPDENLQETLSALVARRQEVLRRGVRAEQTEFRYRLSDFVSNSLAMQNLLSLAGRVATADTSLLILGETGVGKEWLARAIHTESPRSGAPFIAVNCAALPEGLLESELFGHEKGAFTGALRARRGHFELAHGGTLFLDEIGEMTPALQAKLLRALQERKIQRVGGEEPIAVDVRIIAASNRDMDAAIKSGVVRKDLYFRLGVVTLTLPPLRDRPEDIPELVDSYITRFRVQVGRPVKTISPEASEALTTYSWPGNVRELVNVLERAVLLCKGTELTLEDLPENLVASRSRESVAQAGPRSSDGLLSEKWLSKPLEVARAEWIERFEREYLSRLLQETGGRVGQAAERAGIDPRTLYNKMRRYDLSKEDFKPMP